MVEVIILMDSSDNLTFTNFGSGFKFTGDFTLESWVYPNDSGAQ